MFFKNIILYRLLAPWAIALEQLEEQLKRAEFVPCPSNQACSRGWVSPRKDGALVYANNQQWMIALRIEKRLLPSSVVNAEVAIRANAIQDQQGYAPGRKMLKEIKERVTEELLSRAFTQKQTVFVWIDPKNGYLAIDSGSQSKADDVLEMLRLCLDQFPVKSLYTHQSPTSAMADWLAGGDAPTGFTIDRDCELKANGEEKSTVSFKRHPLGDEISDEIKSHLAAGKLPTKLALTWDDRISFVLGENIEIKRLHFLDLLKEQAEKEAKVADEQFDADFAIMTGELTRFIPMLIDALGGEQQDLADQGR